MKPRISVIIPAYNHGRYLRAAVESVRAQTWPGLEIILIDDGSTDETPRVARELSGDDFRYIRQERSGVAAARNRGIKESEAEWIAILDADDYWLPGKLAEQMRVLEESGADFCYSGCLVVDEEGKTLREHRAEKRRLVVEALVWGNLFGASTMVVRRSCLMKVGLFNESLPTLGEDWDMWLRLATDYSEACVPRPLVVVRFRPFKRKYEVRNLERATRQVVAHFFDSLKGRDKLAQLLRQKRRVTSYHLSVLAKSYLSEMNLSGFLRCGARSILTHPVGLRYVLPAHSRQESR